MMVMMVTMLQFIKNCLRVEAYACSVFYVIIAL
jgi:hypothetical protein